LKPALKRMNRLIQRASVSPFYRGKLRGAKALRAASAATLGTRLASFTLEELVEETSRSGDPYASRWCRKKAPPLVFQLEYDTEPRLYLPLDRAALSGYAEALTRCWSLLGLAKGDKVAIFDYGTSPLSYLASASYTPYLNRGAAEALGCLPVCNDGVPNMSRRAVEILKFIRPQIFFLRSDCLQPFISQAEAAALRISDYTRALVIAECEGALRRDEQTSFEQRLGVPLYQMLRIDAAMFLAMECPQCRLLHTWRDLYLVESSQEDGGEIYNSAPAPLLITNWFALNCPTLRYASQIQGSLAAPGCPRGPGDQRISL
jgi:phenylacetate-coenzyme A ligase PaaK-like adenylate-forming protein